MRTSRPLAVLCCLAALVTACTDGGSGADQVVQPPPSPSAAPPSPADPSPTAAPSPSPSPVAAAPIDGPLAAELLAVAEFPAPVRFEVLLQDPSTPAELAAAIVDAEEDVRDPTLSADARLVAAHRAQRAYRQLGRERAWQDEVLAALPGPYDRIARGNSEARDALDRLRGSGEAPTALPAWEVVAPEPADALLSSYREAEATYGVDWEVLAAINLVETRMGRIVGFSTAQARGPMQFIPESWEIFGEGGDIDDARDSIMAAARHLTQRPGDPPSERNALLRYNRSSDYGDAVIAIADVLREHPDEYATYHGWQVYFSTEEDEFLLPVGYREEQPVPVDEYLAREAVGVVG